LAAMIADVVEHLLLGRSERLSHGRPTR
jgi:hypothetical protein